MKLALIVRKNMLERGFVGKKIGNLIFLVYLFLVYWRKGNLGNLIS